MYGHIFCHDLFQSVKNEMQLWMDGPFLVDYAPDHFLLPDLWLWHLLSLLSDFTYESYGTYAIKRACASPQKANLGHKLRAKGKALLLYLRKEIGSNHRTSDDDGVMACEWPFEAASGEATSSLRGRSKARCFPKGNPRLSLREHGRALDSVRQNCLLAHLSLIGFVKIYTTWSSFRRFQVIW